MRLTLRAVLALLTLPLAVALLAGPLQDAMTSLGLHLLGWQRDFHRALTLAITEASGTPSVAAWGGLLGVSFAYGVFHAAGPGHGKAVLSAYLLSQGGVVRRALVLSFAAALLQGAVAIILVVGLVHGLGWLTRQAMGSVAWVEQASYAMVMLLGGWLCLRAVRQLRRVAHAPSPDGDHRDPAHGGACCGGGHHLDPVRVADWRTALATVVAIGLRPCSGAVLLLGAATLLGRFSMGAAAVVVMSLGTALTVSMLALASVLARGWAERRVARQSDGRRLGRLVGWTALVGGLAILAVGASLMVNGASGPAASTLLGEPPAREGGGHPLGGGSPQ
jgi:nickel/cobalt transporter (NicO) family protein